MNNRIDVLGVGFDAVTMAKAVDRALALMEEKNSEYVVTPNPEIVMRARDDAEVPARGKRRPGGRGDTVIEDAPGRYVAAR